jgi:hypothetical protein
LHRRDGITQNGCTVGRLGQREFDIQLHTANYLNWSDRFSSFIYGEDGLFLKQRCNW